MPQKIAHISDLHFGGKFDSTLWAATASTIIAQKPCLIIVSGDLVDHPIERNLKSAKEELDKLSETTGARYFVVPGNHDMFNFGNDFFAGRTELFYDIFWSGASEDIEYAVTLQEETGFKKPVVTLIGEAFGKLGLSSCNSTRKKRKRAPLIHEPGEAPVLLALLDSNVALNSFGFATGAVSDEDLVELDRALAGCKNQHLLRIAVLHHHVLPIAHTAGKLVGAEPFMVLQNAGDLLEVLTRYRFDLVLHGHKHRSQFARADFCTDSTEGYPLAVAAAGSACLRPGLDPKANSFNMIVIDDNGGFSVETYCSGHGCAPRLERSFKELIANVKRRAYVRARERHDIHCERKEFSYKVTGYGDLHVTHETVGMQRVHGTRSISARVHRAFIPPQGRFVVRLDLTNESKRAGYSVKECEPPSEGCKVVVFPNALDAGAPASYAFEHACANSVVMTSWEMEERGRTGEDEWMAALVSHPLGELVLNLDLPECVDSIPYVRCERSAGFPKYEIDDCGDAALDTATEFHLDKDMTEAEEQNLRFEPSDRRWRLVVRQPMVGYRYSLRWKVPETPRPSEPIPWETSESRKALLELGERIRAAALTETDKRAVTAFEELAVGLAECLGSPMRKSIVDLFVYDEAKLVLRPVICSLPDPLPPRSDAFEIPLGQGVAGAAFVQRRVIPWRARRNGDAEFITPVSYPHVPGGATGMPFSSMLSIPYLHPLQQDVPQPSPWSVVAVVAFATTAGSSKIPEMTNRELSPESSKILDVVRGLCHSQIFNILKILAEEEMG